MHALGLTEADGCNANIVAVHINLHILRCVNVHLVIILSGVVACAVAGRNRCVRTGLFVLIAVRAFQYNLNTGGGLRHLQVADHAFVTVRLGKELVNAVLQSNRQAGVHQIAVHIQGSRRRCHGKNNLTVLRLRNFKITDIY